MSGKMAASGFVVSPIYENVSIGEHQPTAHYVVSLTNTTDKDQAFKLSTIDFGSLNESGGVAFLGTSSSSFAKKYGLSKWMKLDDNTVDVAAGKSVSLGVSIVNSDSLTSGGHYGAILATALTVPTDKAAQPRVGVFEVLSSLILLIKQGNTQITMDLVSQEQNGGWWKMPSVVTDRFKATGNVHVVPRGLVEVKDPLGRLVSRGSMNVNSNIILPGNARKYDTPLMKLAAVRWPGVYSVISTYRVDGSTTTTTFSTVFWYLGPVGLLCLLVLLLGAAGGLWWWLRWRGDAKA